MEKKEYTIVIKDGYYWLAKAIEYPKLKGLEEMLCEQKNKLWDNNNVKLTYITVYEIDTTLEHNGFEREIDAWSYIAHLQGFPEDKR